MAGSAMSGLIRIEITFPGSLLKRENIFYVIITSHALLIIFFIVIPRIIGGFGNWLLPIILSAPDMSFPRLNNLSY